MAAPVAPEPMAAMVTRVVVVPPELTARTAGLVLLALLAAMVSRVCVVHQATAVTLVTTDALERTEPLVSPVPRARLVLLAPTALLAVEVTRVMLDSADLWARRAARVTAVTLVREVLPALLAIRDTRAPRAALASRAARARQVFPAAPARPVILVSPVRTVSTARMDLLVAVV